MSKSTIEMLISLIQKKGALKSADLLGHKDTSRINRWKKEGEIPTTLEPGIRAQLETISKRENK